MHKWKCKKGVKTMGITREEREDIERNEQKEDEHWEKKRANCEHQYQPIGGNYEMESDDVVAIEIECVECGNRAIGEFILNDVKGE